MRVGILTISTSRSDREDASGDTIAAWCAQRGDQITHRGIVTDSTDRIAVALIEWCDAGDTDVILTTGGTGLSPTDVTPEATRAVIDREAPGISEAIRQIAFSTFPRAALSRGIAGVRGSTLVINLPGSPGGVRDGLKALDPIIDHACDVLGGKVTQHDK